MCKAQPHSCPLRNKFPPHCLIYQRVHFFVFRSSPFLQRVLIHLAIMPLVAGVSYELIRKAGQADSHGIFKWIAKPGMLLQNLTTREPDHDQIEVAIKALTTVLERDQSRGELDRIHPFPTPSTHA